MDLLTCRPELRLVVTVVQRALRVPPRRDGLHVANVAHPPAPRCRLGLAGHADTDRAQPKGQPAPIRTAAGAWSQRSPGVHRCGDRFL